MALRPKDSTVGAVNSLHKVGKALDFRLNADSKKLVNMSEQQKRQLGIKKAEIHDNHVHLEFL